MQKKLWSGEEPGKSEGVVGTTHRRHNRLGGGSSKTGS